jgi:hypothetical protein
MAVVTFDDIEEKKTESGGVSFDDLPEAKPRSWGQYAADVAENVPRRFLQGATFGFGEEISSAAAALPSLLNEKDFSTEYAKNLAFQRSKLEEAKKETPYSGGAAELGGVIGPSLLAAPAALANWVGTGGRLARTVKGAVVGTPVAGASGALYGYGTGEGGAENRTRNAIDVGVPSAVIGAAAPLAIGAVGAALHPFQTAKGAANLFNNITDKIAGGISKKLNVVDLGDDLVKDARTGMQRSDAEILFLKTLKDEGISVDDALESLKTAQSYGVSPSVAASSNIPQMKTQAHLLVGGSAGSSTAEKAIKDITENQIPSLNKKAIEVATGAGRAPAESYGKIVADKAKSLVDEKIKTLQTRAKPHYQNSVGVDKSIPIESPMMKKALENPLVVKSLDDFRADPYTLTNVKKELADLGVDSAQLEKLPYNSTISLHAARTHLRGLADSAYSAGEKQKGTAIKEALKSIDDAIESSYPSYKTARHIYSEDAGALKVLKESPVGKMATFSEGDYSKIANDLMQKDPAYISKFLNNVKDQKMRDSIAGSFLSRKLEESGGDALRFSQSVFRSEGSANRLKALVGEDRFNQLKKIDEITDLLLETKNMKSGSITSPSQALRGDVEFPKDKDTFFSMVREKIAPSLLEMVRKDPIASKEYIDLLLTDKGYKLLESMSKGNKGLMSDVEKVGRFLNENATKISEKVK